eukprot:1180421-Prorocentrum_minimum.AAC.3
MYGRPSIRNGRRAARERTVDSVCRAVWGGGDGASHVKQPAAGYRRLHLRSANKLTPEIYDSDWVVRSKPDALTDSCTRSWTWTLRQMTAGPIGGEHAGAYQPNPN